MDRTNNYNDLKPFRFWCQKVLPLVYDDSLSYYELLDKVIDYLNKTMEDVTVLNDDTEALYAAYNQLQSYVNSYFDNLDVQDEINAKLDQMAIDGTLSSLINPQIPGAVSAWLAANVDPVGSAVIVDATLSIAGAAADAKATGDALNGKQDILTFDYTPTAGSGNPVRSAGIKTYVDGSVANVVGEIADLRQDVEDELDVLSEDFEDEITELRNDLNNISDKSENIFFFTNSTNRTVNSVNLTFPDESTIELNGTQNSTTTNLNLMGAKNYNANIFNPCLAAGTYSYKQDITVGTGTTAGSALYYRTRTMFNNNESAILWSNNSTKTFTDDVELIYRISPSRTYAGRICKIMLVSGTVIPDEYISHDYATAIDVVAREAINDLETAVSEIEDSVSEIEESVTLITKTKICCIGDSLTNGAGGNGTTYENVLASNNPDLVVNKCGFSGKGSGYIARAVGGYNIYVNPFTIPETTTAVEINIVVQSFSNYPLSLVGDINPVIIGGVAGTLSYQNSKNYFTRSESGEAVTLTRPEKIIVGFTQKYTDNICIIWMGTNNTSISGKDDGLFNDIKNVIKELKLDRYIVLPVMTKNKFSNLDAIINYYAYNFGVHFINHRAYFLAYGLQDANVTPTEQDLTDIANGEIPTSLRSDDTHLNAKGYTVLGNYLYKQLKILGYVD